jgi:hypothetical protein
MHACVLKYVPFMMTGMLCVHSYCSACSAKLQQTQCVSPSIAFTTLFCCTQTSVPASICVPVPATVLRVGAAAAGPPPEPLIGPVLHSCLRATGS